MGEEKQQEKKQREKSSGEERAAERAINSTAEDFLHKVMIRIGPKRSFVWHPCPANMRILEIVTIPKPNSRDDFNCKNSERGNKIPLRFTRSLGMTRNIAKCVTTVEPMTEPLLEHTPPPLSQLPPLLQKGCSCLTLSEKFTFRKKNPKA